MTYKVRIVNRGHIRNGKVTVEDILQLYDCADLSNDKKIFILVAVMHQ